TQVGNTIDLFYGIDETIAYLSQYFTLKTGDLLFTGCPMGGQTINVNDQLTGYLGERKVLEISCK
ncbi:MAG: fumarylacetoacetate hydrolase family protein, partial [Prevotella sp.]|nr:fumarylacetoacetate hydrolase family protein [Prevotella sp.]